MHLLHQRARRLHKKFSGGSKLPRPAVGTQILACRHRGPWKILSFVARSLMTTFRIRAWMNTNRRRLFLRPCLPPFLFIMAGVRCRCGYRWMVTTWTISPRRPGHSPHSLPPRYCSPSSCPVPRPGALNVCRWAFSFFLASPGLRAEARV